MLHVESRNTTKANRHIQNDCRNTRAVRSSLGKTCGYNNSGMAFSEEMGKEMIFNAQIEDKRSKLLLESDIFKSS